MLGLGGVCIGGMRVYVCAYARVHVSRHWSVSVLDPVQLWYHLREATLTSLTSMAQSLLVLCSVYNPITLPDTLY